MDRKKYLSIISHYEACLEKHGDTHLGVDWPNKADAETRYRVMLDVINQAVPSKPTLLDFGCGLSHLYEYMLKSRIKGIDYAGLDISEEYVRLSRRKFPSNTYYCIDILDQPTAIPNFDYIVMNGVFTEKNDLSFDEMFSYFKEVLRRAFEKANTAIAFNVMSKHVDWEREDLFHLPFDTLADFLTRELSRKFVIRNDYGLYEYTTYVYK
jgi:cyclopropane fatty-acyl-phospholipid synthase-like methyltransferase